MILIVNVQSSILPLEKEISQPKQQKQKKGLSYFLYVIQVIMKLTHNFSAKKSQREAICGSWISWITWRVTEETA